MSSPDTTPGAADLFPFHALRASTPVLAAVLAFPMVAAVVALAAPRLAVLQHGSPVVLAANHLVTLGWGTLVAIGALHQMLPAVAGVRRDLSPLLAVQVTVHLGGVVLLAAGFMTGSLPLQTSGGTAVVLSVLATLGIGARTVRQRRRALPVLRYAAAAMASLGAAVIWGLILALNRRLAFWPWMLRPAGLNVHLTLGLIGWFGFLIVGMSYYLLPRFANRSAPSPGHPGPVFVGLAAAMVALLGATAWPGLAQAGLLLLGATGALYAADLFHLVSEWRTRARDIARAHWWVLMIETALLSMGTVVAALDGLPGLPLRWAVAGVTLFLLGWVTLAITGQAYKVTPFLMWYYRFSVGLSALDVPRLDAPYWPRVAVAPFILLTCAAPVVALGVLLAEPRLCRAGGVAYLAGAMLFAFGMGYSWLPVLWRGRRARAAAEAG
ncbi:MAG: hypothetical protein QN178_11535 [Armatimonadota bacterium]|nr:hypothetical protein [Armatimonadota bacterium]